MQAPIMWIVFIFLSGTISSGLSLNSRQDVETYLETSSEAPGLETAVALPPATNAASDAHASTLPAGEMFYLFFFFFVND